MAAAKLGSIAAASKQLQIAGSAISRQIANLEEEFDCVLFDRLPRGMVLTDAGRLLAEQATAMLYHIDLAVSEIQSFKGINRGRVRVASSIEFVPKLMSRVVDYGGRFPDVAIDLVVSDHQGVADSVESMDCEIGIVVSCTSYDTVRSIYRVEEDLIALSSIGHGAFPGGNLPADELWKHPLALMPVGNPTRDLLEDIAASAGRVLDVRFCSNEITAILAFVRANQCVTVTPSLFFDGAPRGLHATALTIDSGSYPSLQTQVFVNKDRTISPVANAFLSSLLAWLSSTAPR
jgi:DNA-binding transcriptional LysR family regulator